MFTGPAAQFQSTDPVTKVNPAGRVSVMLIGFCASDGPLFVTVIVNGTIVPRFHISCGVRFGDRQVRFGGHGHGGAAGVVARVLRCGDCGHRGGVRQRGASLRTFRSAVARTTIDCGCPVVQGERVRTLIVFPVGRVVAGPPGRRRLTQGQPNRRVCR